VGISLLLGVGKCFGEERQAGEEEADGEDN